MSLITRCPSCLTSFQVTQSQLAQASGWVRCGRCDQIFDGATHLMDSAADDTPVLEPAPGKAGDAVAQHAPGGGPIGTADAPARPGDPAPGPGADGPPPPDLGLLTPAEPSPPAAFAEPVLAHPGSADILDPIRPGATNSDGPLEPTLDPVPETKATAEADPESGDGPGTDTADPHAADAPLAAPAGQPEPVGAESDPPPRAAEPVPAQPVADDERATGGPAPETTGEAGPVPAGDEAATPASAPAPAAPHPDPADTADVDGGRSVPRLEDSAPRIQPTPLQAATGPAEPSFVARARRRAFWNHGLVRAGLWLLLLILGATLAGQWALHERDRLAAEHPQWAPALNALCRTLGCTVAPYRKLDALAITSSRLKRLNDDAFELDVSLRNQGASAVAVPALELTLTDLSERILVRRVIRPAELDAPERLAAHGQWHGRRALVLDANAGAAGVVNYKLQMFYP